MSDKSMLEYFAEELKKGNADLTDPFEAATEEAAVEKDVKPELTEEQKAAMRLAWNNRIYNLFGGEEKLREKMLNQHARRCSRIMRRR